MSVLAGYITFSKRPQQAQAIHYTLESAIQAAANGNAITLSFDQMLDEVKAFVANTQQRMHASGDWLQGQMHTSIRLTLQSIITIGILIIIMRCLKKSLRSND